MHSPFDIRLILACDTSPEPQQQFTAREWNREYARLARDQFRADGLIDDNNRTTSKGALWADAICKTPFPKH